MANQQQYLPLEFAKSVSDHANAAWDDGSFIQAVTPTTRELLTYWFNPAYVDLRQLNFHQGQRQAILNVIYLHEVLKEDNILNAYRDLLQDGVDLATPDLYLHPKYAIKMATGTGKTWVMEALLLWQYLNARHHELGNYTKNFLVVAPGLIVYERLVEAFQGKLTDDGVTRNFDTSDLRQNEELFIPEQYRDEVYGFLQSSVAAKTEIGSKVTGDGVIAITNFHLLMGADEQRDLTDDNGDGVVDHYSLPVSPGVSAGNSLDVLDNSLNGKKELEYLRSLPNLMVMNDEAHHIHAIKRGGEIQEVEWAKSLHYIAETKGRNYIQVDFSATPYNQQGDKKLYFPHIVVDFDLQTAIRGGLVKMLLLGERSDLSAGDLDYRSLRSESGDVIDLSDGQKVMLRAGLSRLKMLEDEFATAITPKIPKMMVVCEDTNVVPHVTRFLQDEGLDDDDILEIHSNKKGEVGEAEWQELKHKLFSLDKGAKPRVVVSVLMLREGFDVNNICVVVPLRSSQSNILLEQTIGRGLRLMWRGNEEIDELKRENRRLVLSEHKRATNYFDTLTIIEHPAFRKFYDDLMNDGLIGTDDLDDDNPTKPKGDLLVIGLRDNYWDYDFRFPRIMYEAADDMKLPELRASKLPVYPIKLDSLRPAVSTNDTWTLRETTEKVYAGTFNVTANPYNATSYNDYLMKIVNRITARPVLTAKGEVNRHKVGGNYPMLSVDKTKVAALIDDYIRHYMFGGEFNPAIGNSWKILQIDDIVNFIVGRVSGLIVEVQDKAAGGDNAKVVMTPLSTVDKITVRENYQVDVHKCIYPVLPYPSNRGLFERDFTEYADHDGQVDALCKIIENRHTFVRFRYVREDGLPSEYIPDFFVRFGNDVYVVETKAQNQVSNENVQRKKRAAVRWLDNINELPANKRDGLTWRYVILADGAFHEMVNRHVPLLDILRFVELRHDDDGGMGRQARLI